MIKSRRPVTNLRRGAKWPEK